MKFAAALSFLFLSCSAFLMADNAALAAKAREQIGVTTSYDGSYQVIPYPNGDVPKDTGVCTDVVIRALRAFGLDLQKAVHEDMRANFSRYPNLWGLKGTDRSIDHRRCPTCAPSLPARDGPCPSRRRRRITCPATSSRGIWTQGAYPTSASFPTKRRSKARR